MPRPLKESGDKRDRIIRVRFTADEKKLLFRIADEKGLTLSDFIRVLALQTAPARKKAGPDRAAYIRGLAELNKIGSNVNQIARELNRRNPLEPDYLMPDNTQISHTLKGIDAAVRQLIKILADGH